MIHEVCTWVHCPVCKAKLGPRREWMITAENCQECQTTFFWRPKDLRPFKVKMDRDCKKECGCGQCQD